MVVPYIIFISVMNEVEHLFFSLLAFPIYPSMTVLICICPNLGSPESTWTKT